MGTARQGKRVYIEKCQACHGDQGIGGVSDALAGGSLEGDSPVKTVGSYWPYATTLFDYVRRAMPLTQPQSLSADEVYAVSAYILFLNNIITETEPMNAETLPKVEMPNRRAFFTVYPGKLE
jgi:cytochrome c